MGGPSYVFREIDHCRMCLAPSSSSRILGLRLNQSQGLNPRRKSGVAITVHRCTVCDLVFSNPEPQPAHLNEHYDIPVESYWSEGQLSASIDIFGLPFSKAKELLKFEPGMKALDVGTGTGLGFIALEQAGFDAWAMEPSPSFRAKALELTKASEGRIALTSIEEAEYPENTFDFVTFGSVFEHLYNPSRALERSMNFLRPGGIWHADVPSSNWLNARMINAYFKLIGTSFVTNLSPMHPPFHIHEFTHNTFANYAERTGLFEVCSYRYEVCPIRSFPRILHPLIHKIMERTDTGLQLHVWLRRL
jgi:ubiquinone/menaquinone biosynthesis C-methylase UbiE